MGLNKQLIEQVRDHVLAEPRRYDQGTFGESVPVDISPCGTQACLAGWAVMMAGRMTLPEIIRSDSGVVMSEAALAMGLDDLQAENLFGWNWPEPFAQEYSNADAYEDSAARARVAGDLLNAVIATDGAILDFDSGDEDDEEDGDWEW